MRYKKHWLVPLTMLAMTQNIRPAVSEVWKLNTKGRQDLGLDGANQRPMTDKQREMVLTAYERTNKLGALLEHQRKSQCHMQEPLTICRTGQGFRSGLQHLTRTRNSILIEEDPITTLIEYDTSGTPISIKWTSSDVDSAHVLYRFSDSNVEYLTADQVRYNTRGLQCKLANIQPLQDDIWYTTYHNKCHYKLTPYRKCCLMDTKYGFGCVMIKPQQVRQVLDINEEINKLWTHLAQMIEETDASTKTESLSTFIVDVNSAIQTKKMTSLTTHYCHYVSEFNGIYVEILFDEAEKPNSIAWQVWKDDTSKENDKRVLRCLFAEDKESISILYLDGDNETSLVLSKIELQLNMMGFEYLSDRLYVIDRYHLQ